MESNVTIFEETIYNVTDIHLCDYLIFICHSCHTEEQGFEEY